MQGKISNKNQFGFTLLELVIVIIIISVLALFAIERMFIVRAAAERSSVLQLVGTIKSALGLEVARLALARNMNGVAKLDKSNPINLLSQEPNNYLGEKLNITETGVWYFDKKQKILIYNINYSEHFTTSLKGTPRIRYRIKLIYNDRNKNKRFDAGYDSIAGLDLLPLDNFSWNIKAKQLPQALKEE